MTKSSRQHVKIAAALAVAALSIAGCSRSARGPDVSVAKRTFTDAIGREVAVPVKPLRIVSLAPAITETLFAVDAGPQVVGVTRYCDFPAEAKTKEKVGDTLNPNPERLIALKPNLIIITTSSQLEKLMRQLGEEVAALSAGDSCDAPVSHCSKWSWSCC